MADPSGARGTKQRVLAAIPNMKRMAKDPQRWKSEAASELFQYLSSSGASGPAFSIEARLQENAEGRRKMAEQTLLTKLGGRDKFTATTGPGGVVIVSLAGQPLRSLDILRGLQIDSLDVSGTAITDLEPLRGMRLQSLNASNTKIGSVVALKGMPLRKLVLDNSPVQNIDSLKGAPLETLSLEGTKVYTIDVVMEMPLRVLNLKNSLIVNKEFSPKLKGLQVKELDVRRCKNLTDLSAVLTMPNLEKFSCDVMPKDLSALRQSKTLQTIEADVIPGEGSQGARPAAAFWADFDAKGGAPR